MLDKMFAIQKELVRKFTKVEDFDKVPDSERQLWTHRYFNCAIEEIVEAIRECPARKFWSPGAIEKPRDKEKLLEEFTDVLHFLCAVAAINGWSAQEVLDVYLKKNEVNRKRFNV